MTRYELMELLENEECLLADGFDKALIGIGYQFNRSFAIYDRDKVIKILMKDGMDYEDAVEFFDFNIGGAYVGDKTPAFAFIANGKEDVRPSLRRTKNKRQAPPK